jgi:hypothetical protein
MLIVANLVANLPKVLSRHNKVVYMDKKVGEELLVFYIDLKKGRVEQGCPSSEPKEDGSGHS